MKYLKNPLLILTISLLAMSCGNDDPAKVSATKAQATFSSVNQTLAAELGDMESTPGFTGMNAFASITETSSPFGRISAVKDPKTVREFVGKAGHSFRSMLVSATENGRVAGDEPFNYDAHKGVYTWNGEGWDYSATGTIIKIIFPSEGSATNNAEFQLTAYEEVATPNGDDLYSPTLINATLYVDDAKEAEIDLNVEYGDDDAPEFADVYFLIEPFSIQLDLDDTKSTASSFSIGLSKSGNNLIGFGASVTYYNSTKTEDAIKTVSAYVQLINIRFIVKIDTSSMQSADDINDLVNITIKIDGAVAGKVVLEADEFGGYTPYVRYNDGSKVLLDTLFEDLFLQLDGILS